MMNLDILPNLETHEGAFGSRNMEGMHLSVGRVCVRSNWLGRFMKDNCNNDERCVGGSTIKSSGTTSTIASCTKKMHEIIPL